ncbi:ATP synthase subunit g, mitochondrial-like isoform X1 [Liolophura sinensis]|uniref:ATP synthase subunit g, mitochondrial-like isoform X1 n=1 Tax=Liolophura sinensis TaxID=3198878 RepID=UPI003158D979
MAKAAQKVGSLGARLAQRGPEMAKGAVAFSRPKLQTFWKYARVEMKPPTLSDLPQIQQGIQNLAVAVRSGKWKQLTVKEAWLNTLISLEIVCWFFVGEIIGKRSIVGYHIPGAVNFDAGV